MHYIQAPRYEDSAFEIGYQEEAGIKTYSRERKEKKDIYKIQGKAISGAKYNANIPYRTVFVSPFDMNLFYFAPSIRRDMLDSILERAFGQFRSVRREYENIVRQRNALLKKIREGEAERSNLSYWNALFVEKAHIYHLYRMKWRDFVDEYIEYIQSYLPKYSITHTYTCKIEEKCREYGLSVEESLTRYLDENRERDIITGHTHIGPHLDDFSFLIGTNADEIATENALFLSRGENKMLLLALKQIEILFLKKQVHLPIILLFDDVFAELDLQYAEKLIQSFEADQVIMTSQRSLPEGRNWENFSCIHLDSAYHAENS